MVVIGHVQEMTEMQQKEGSESKMSEAELDLVRLKVSAAMTYLN